VRKVVKGKSVLFAHGSREGLLEVVSGMASVIRLRGDEMRSERRKRSAAGK